MKHKVWIGYPLMPEPLARLAAETEVIHSPAGSTKLAELLADLPGVAAVILGADLVADGAFMDTAGETLKVIARHGIGVDNVELPAATGRGILVVNTPDAPTESTAEHAVALLLAPTLRLEARLAQRETLRRPMRTALTIGVLYIAVAAGVGLGTTIIRVGIAGSFLVAVGCGVVFGILPARRAARLDPIAALAGR